MYQLISDPAFFNRVRMAAINAAIDVLQDPALKEQYEYCQSIIDNPLSDTWLQPMVISVIQNPSIAANLNSSTDGDIQFVVNSVFSLFSIKPEPAADATAQI